MRDRTRSRHTVRRCLSCRTVLLLSLIALVSAALIGCDNGKGKDRHQLKILKQSSPFSNENVGEYARSAVVDDKTLLLAHSNTTKNSVQTDTYSLNPVSLDPISTEHILTPAAGANGPKKYLSLSAGPNQIALSFFDTLTSKVSLALKLKTDSLATPWELHTLKGQSHAQASAVAYSPSGKLALIYQRTGQKNELVLAVSPDGTFSSLGETVIDHKTKPGLFADLLWMGDDFLYIAYYTADTRDLRLALYRPSSNQIEKVMVVDSQGDVGQYVRMAQNRDHRLYIAYHDYTDGSLKLATSVRPTMEVFPDNFEIQVIDTEGHAGMDPFVELYNGTIPVITYLDGSRLALKMAILRDGAWQIKTLDDKGAGGFYSGIVPVPNKPGLLLVHHHLFRSQLKTDRGVEYAYERLALLLVSSEDLK